MSGPRETLQTVAAWSAAMFGPVPVLRAVARANEEMAELIRAAAADRPSASTILEECADVLIVLYRVAELVGGDLHAAVDGKMIVNRGRRWRPDGSGCSYHLEHEP